MYVLGVKIYPFLFVGVREASLHTIHAVNLTALEIVLVTTDDDDG